MRFITAFLTILHALALADYSCANNTGCVIHCGNSTQCQDSLIDASLATNLTMFCPYLNSCRNMTTICPVGKGTICDISCTDSFSCDRTTIHSESTETIFNCISPNITKTNICTKNITINLSQNTNTLTVNCSGTNVTVCDHITVSTDTTQSNTFVSFNCQGNGVHCDTININTPNINTLQVIVNGNMGHLNASTFINNNNMDIQMNGGSLTSLSSFIGPTMTDGSDISILISNESISRSNTFIFNDVSSFKITNPKLTAPALLTHSNITISNEAGRSQSVEFESINGDGNNYITAQRAHSFVLKCRNNDTECGSFGIIDVMYVYDVMILIDNGVNFTNTMDATDVLVFNITVLEGGILDGFLLDVSKAGQIHFNVYGQTRGKNVIGGSEAPAFDVYCNNPKSCSDDLEIYISPRRTNIHCIGTGCDMMTFIVPNSADELSVTMEYCPCYDERRTLCITEWDIICNDKTSTIKDKECTGECCGGIMGELQQTYSNKYECPVSNQTMYICEEEEECSIDCRNTTQYDEESVFECSLNSVIDGSMAHSLDILCDKGDAACNGLNVLCPDTVNNESSSCRVNCTAQGGCVDLEIDSLQSTNIMVNCLFNGSCSNITINNTAVNTHLITIICSDGLCKDINVIGDNMGDVLFKCIHNSTCNGMNIVTFEGEIVISMSVSSDFTDSNIWSDAVTITGDEYVFKQNNITFLSEKSTLNVDGNGRAVFDSNTLIENESSNQYILSINIGSDHKDTNAILFHKTNDKLMFETADKIQITTTENNSFTNKTVKVINSMAQVFIMNLGTMRYVIFDTEEIEAFYYGCKGISSDNKLMVDYVSLFYVVALSDINGKDTEITASNVERLTLNVNNGGSITNFNFDEMHLKSVEITNSGGMISNISLNATGATNFTLNCFGGCHENTVITNRYYLQNVSNVGIKVSENDRVNASNTNLLNIKNITKLHFGAINGSINDIMINETLKYIELMCDVYGIIDNFSITSQMVDDIKIENEGMINELNIKPNKLVNKVSVNITGLLSNSSIDSSKANNLSMICANHCSNITLFVPVSEDAVSSLFCRNESCQSFTFYTVNNMNDINVSLTECPCDLAVKSSCIQGGNEWHIYCETNNNDKASILVENKCNGVCCGDIVKDLRINGCDYSDDGKKNNKAGAIVGGVCGAILGCVMIAAAIYYFTKKKKAEQQALLLNQ